MIKLPRPFDFLLEYSERKRVYPKGVAGRAMKFASKVSPIQWKDAPSGFLARLRRFFSS